MDWATMSEESYKNGRTAGFADGLAAAGIAPIQWRSTEDVPVPEAGSVILWTIDREYPSGYIAHSGRKGYVHLVINSYGQAIWVPVDRIRFWCPVQSPDGTEVPNDEE